MISNDIVSTHIQFILILIVTTSGEGMNLDSRRTSIRTTTFKSNFFNRIVDMWNVLPLKVRQASNISNFKKVARDFLLSRYD